MIALIPVMTSNTSPDGYIADANNEQYNPAYRAFHGVEECWQPNATNGWLTIQLPKEYLVTQYSLTHRNYADWGNRYPSNFTLDAWNGTSWVTLDTQKEAPPFANTGDIHIFKITNITPYRKYRLNVISNAGGAGLMVFGLQLYGSQPATNKNQATSGGT